MPALCGAYQARSDEVSVLRRSGRTLRCKHEGGRRLFGSARFRIPLGRNAAAASGN